jgi:hypothetical protein
MCALGRATGPEEKGLTPSNGYRRLFLVLSGSLPFAVEFDQPCIKAFELVRATRGLVDQFLLGDPEKINDLSS